MPDNSPVTVLTDIPFKAEDKALSEALQLEANPWFRDDVEALAREAEAVARPKGVYKVSAVEPLGDDKIAVDGVTFTSRVLRVNVADSGRVFPFIATCGQEIETWSRDLDDPMKQFWADGIKEMALGAAIHALGEHLVETYQPGARAMMNPGSAGDWPVKEQPALFSIFDDVPEQLGVTLSKSHLMSPVKSVSGVWFQTEDGFESCQLCPILDCPKRRAPYDEHLFDREYKL